MVEWKIDCGGDGLDNMYEIINEQCEAGTVQSILLKETDKA